jgi:hypothetical protein
LTAPRLLSSAAVFLQLEGTENKNIKLDGGDISKAAAVFACKKRCYEKGSTTTRLNRSLRNTQ